jgi:hypothetical protein
MKVIVYSLTEKGQERRDYRDVLEIEVDGKRAFSVYDGEPEDATLARDFSDCWSIGGLMEDAHKAGVNGEPFSLEYRKEDEV